MILPNWPSSIDSNESQSHSLPINDTMSAQASQLAKKQSWGPTIVEEDRGKYGQDHTTVDNVKNAEIDEKDIWVATGKSSWEKS